LRAATRVNAFVYTQMCVHTCQKDKQDALNKMRSKCVVKAKVVRKRCNINFQNTNLNHLVCSLVIPLFSVTYVLVFSFISQTLILF